MALQERYPIILFSVFYKELRANEFDINRFLVDETSANYLPPRGKAESVFYELLKKQGYNVWNNTRFFHGKRFDKIYERISKNLSDVDTSIKYTVNKVDYYYPDILVYNKITNTILDIEIDEPYDAIEGKPIHCIDNEEEIIEKIRNDYFNDKGIIVVRLAEEQIIKHADACLDVIKSLLSQIENIDFEKPISEDFIQKYSSWKEDMYVNRWTSGEAVAMAGNNYRKLNAEFYNNEELKPIEQFDPIKLEKARRIEAAHKEWKEAIKRKEEYTGNDERIIFNLSNTECMFYLRYCNAVQF